MQQTKSSARKTRNSSPRGCTFAAPRAKLEVHFRSKKMLTIPHTSAAAGKTIHPGCHKSPKMPIKR